jgi:hypothetical protein
MMYFHTHIININTHKKSSAGGVIALVCGSKGWGGLDSDWATDALRLMEVQLSLARNFFTPPDNTRPSVAEFDLPHSSLHTTLNNNNNVEYAGYCRLMLATFQIIAHSMDALIYRFLHMFKRLRYFEDIESNKVSVCV